MELVPEAVENAVANAKANGCTNVAEALADIRWVRTKVRDIVVCIKSDQIKWLDFGFHSGILI